MKRLAVLGSTGSVGSACLEVVESFPDEFEVVAIGAGHNLDRLRRQVARHRPALVAVAEADAARTLAAEFHSSRFVAGEHGLIDVARCEHADMVVSALVGSVGLAPTLAAVEAGKDIALANKEVLVMAGELVMTAVRDAEVNMLPVDSEHSAIHQALQAGPADSVLRIILTASGGPFRTWSTDRMATAGVDDALAHPTWWMGRKISIDSATMMNKGFEVIEAHHLFGVPCSDIDVVVHPQSLVHSLVEYRDGSTIAQLGPTSMRHPILYALAWPERMASGTPPLDLTATGTLEFEPFDETRFPAVGLARNAAEAGGEMPVVLNAANEIAVQRFLGGRCAFGDIITIVQQTLERWSPASHVLENLDHVRAIDAEARTMADGFGNDRA
jgi:1-deoxy-D-xylulose-5-phosphate reductoisomerase